MDTHATASPTSAPSSPRVSVTRAAGHTPPRVTGASAYSSYFSRLSQLLSVSVKHYLPGSAAGSGAADTAPPVAASDRLLGCSLQHGVQRHACSCARHRLSGDNGAGRATCCTGGCSTGGGGRVGGVDAYQLYMCMCYSSGFQVWAVDGAGGCGAGSTAGGASVSPAFREVLSVRDQKPVRRMKVREATTCVGRRRAGGGGAVSVVCACATWSSGVAV